MLFVFSASIAYLFDFEEGFVLFGPAGFSTKCGVCCGGVIVFVFFFSLFPGEGFGNVGVVEGVFFSGVPELCGDSCCPSLGSALFSFL